MLERYYVRPDTIDRVRTSWIGGPIERYVEWLTENGYSARTILRRIPLLMEFGEFAWQHGATKLEELPRHIEGFKLHWFKKHGQSCRTDKPVREFAKSRLVPFGPRMQALLEEYHQLRVNKHGSLLAEEPLFSFGGGRPLNRQTIGNTFRALVSQLELRVPAGTSSPHLHNLRHSFAVGTLGIDPETRLLQLSTFLGHVNPNSTAVYLTITPDLLREANLRFERFATSIIKEMSP